MHKADTGRYNVPLMEDDIAGRGWLPIDLARKAKVSHMTVGRFLRSERQTPRTAAKLARALGHPIARYLIPASSQEAVSA